MSAPRVRSAVGVAILMPWSVNTVIFSGVAYLIRDWRMLQLVMSLLGLLHIPGLWWVIYPMYIRRLMYLCKYIKRT